MATPFERRNQQVWETLNAPGGGPKQALQLINRRLKKGEKDDHLTAMRAFILSHLPSAGMTLAASPLTESASLCSSLAYRNPPIKAKETIQLLETTFVNLGRREDVGKLQEHLYKTWMATPGRTKSFDESGLKEWFNACLKACDWAGMQKAAMMLQKVVPGNRTYYFWAIVACFILFAACDDDQRQGVAIFGTLASRMITKAASEIPEGSELGPARSIRNAPELQLFYEILSFTGAPDAELVKHLESPTTGYKSRLGSDNYWEFWWQSNAAKLRLQESKQVNDECNNVLSSGMVEAAGGTDGTQALSRVWKDDWKVWSAFASSGVELGLKNLESEEWKRTVQTLKESLENESSSRNSLLAAVHFSSLCREHSNLQDAPGVTEFQAACLKFFEKQGRKTSCYDDLRTYVDKLSNEEKQDWLKSVESYCKRVDLASSELGTKELTDLVRERVAYLKFQFWINIANGTPHPSVETLNEFLQGCFDIYNVSQKVDIDLLVTDMRIGDELLILASKTLLCQYAHQRQNDLPLKTAIIILEHILTQSKHNFTALLLIVRLYSIIGALSCATVEYLRLGIKQIQNDTISHHILTRLSTLLPISIASAAKLLNPDDAGDVGLHIPANPTDSLEMYDISLKLYKNANRTNPDMISKAIKNGAYSQVKDMVLFEKRVASSISACHFEIERRRVQRFRGGLGADPSGASWDRVLHRKTSDNRSFDLFGEDGWWRGADMGPQIGAQWAKAFILVETIMAALVAQSQAQGTGEGHSRTQSLSSSSSATGASSSSSKAGGGGTASDGVRNVSPSKQLHEIIDQENEATNEFTPAERQFLQIISLIGDIQTECENKAGAKVKAFLVDLMGKYQALKGSLQISGDATGSNDASTSSNIEAQVAKISLYDLSKDTDSNAPWYALHLTYTILELNKYLLQLCDFLEKSPLAKALKPQVPKSQVTEFKSLIGSTGKSVLQFAKEQAKEAVLVTEADIDAVLTTKGLELESVAEFLKSTVGREKIEAYMDKIARGRSGTWGAVAGVKL